MPSRVSTEPTAPKSRKETKGDDSEPNTPASNSQASLASKKSWYSGGTWKKKGTPVAQVARESVSSIGGVTSESSAEPSKQDDRPSPPAKFLAGNRRQSSKGNAIAASTTKLHVSSSKGQDSKTSLVEESKNQPTTTTSQTDPPLPPDPMQDKSNPKDNKPTDGAITAENENAKASNSLTNNVTTMVASGWYSWWSKPDDTVAADKAKKDAVAKEVEESSNTPLPGASPMEDASNQSKQLGIEPRQQVDHSEQTTSNGTTTEDGKDEAAQRSSWFWLWSSAQNAKSTAAAMVSKPQELDAATSQQTQAQHSPPENTVPEVIESAATGSKADSIKAARSKVEAARSKAEAGWAFWSRAQPNTDKVSADGSTHKQIGELAVADTPSASHPEAAQFNEHEEVQKKEAVQKKEPNRSTSLRGKPKEKAQKAGTSKSATLPPDSPTKPTPSQSPKLKPAEVAGSSTDTTKAAQIKAQQPPNLILPEFRSTYRLAQTPSYWDKVRKYFLGDKEPESPHLHIVKKPAQIKKAVALGIHGYFPALLVQRVLGPPTGTSVRFANAAVTAIKEWTKSQGYECEVESVALEGEGFVSDRVDLLWKLLINWIEKIRDADFILVACHSQGVPVAVMLVAKLLQFGCVGAARIGICAMAGVNLGPFADYKSKILTGSAGELFEFSNPKSMVSQKYQGALQTTLHHGVRILYIGSIDDQLVSLESSTFSNISHPYIYRAVFIDGRLHTPSFVTHLISLVLRLRNLGLPDHGLIRELSPALAGSMMGEGHSRIYDDPNVYLLAVQHALETTSLHPRVNPRLQVGDATGSNGANAFFLPWAMRGLLEEEFVRRELQDEVEGLLREFEEWRPQTKKLLDIKNRLEPVRSKSRL
ncbi:hypothetical protein K490DRAFT_48793 [Saccharata proteae CBS 121410]|uniref:YMC020W-like alpha/beta hydrolase domain-containing protein n=1 Tax=Saccharata proteae CBS 121410 TaxID=1314787 RepID=A0A9P4LSK3_9PEZI|nr:hypothetical protein K490DRAFT_48793 [Saccharata proteae CBS 121410]